MARFEKPVSPPEGGEKRGWWATEGRDNFRAIHSSPRRIRNFGGDDPGSLKRGRTTMAVSGGAAVKSRRDLDAPCMSWPLDNEQFAHHFSAFCILPHTRTRADPHAPARRGAVCSLGCFSDQAFICISREPGGILTAATGAASIWIRKNDNSNGVYRSGIWKKLHMIALLRWATIKWITHNTDITHSSYSYCNILMLEYLSQNLLKRKHCHYWSALHHIDLTLRWLSPKITL